MTKEEYDQKEIDKLYIPYTNQKQYTHQISKGVWYVGSFQLGGELNAKHKLWAWKQAKTPEYNRSAGFIQSLPFQEKALDAALAGLKNSVVFSTTATYYSQFQGACLLKSRGFQLLEGKCYRHPGYELSTLRTVEHPGVPDRRLHYEHVWWKVIGEPEEIGCPAHVNRLNNCGVDSVFGLNGIEEHDRQDRRNYLTIAWLARGTLFPKGWKRFFSGTDYKLGVNFDRICKASHVQECPHEFDLKIFDDWEPDFTKWSPG